MEIWKLYTIIESLKPDYNLLVNHLINHLKVDSIYLAD